ncbi:MAG: LytTR family transcriptional regulator [Bacteroidetes bacterium]|nr:LytTR family transcriptional regulator [Bacteroidota bacterium]
MISDKSNSQNIQDLEKDNIVQQIISAESDTLKAKLLNSLCFKYRNSFPKQSEKYANIALDLSIKNNYKSGMSNAYNNIGVIYKNKGEFETALKFLLCSYQTAELSNDKKLQSSSLSNIGSIYQAKGLFDNSIYYYKKSLEIERKLNDKSQISIRLYNIGVSYESKKNFDLAENFYNESLKIEENAKNKVGIYFAYYGLGGIALKKKDYKNAEIKLSEALKIAKELNEISGLAIVSHELGILNREIKDYPKSLEFFKSSIENAEKIELNSQKLDSYKEIAATYNALGDFKNAFLFQQNYSNLYERINNLNLNNKISELQSTFQRKQAEQENFILTQEQRKQELVSGYNYNIRNFLIIIIILVLIITFSRARKLNEITSDTAIASKKPSIWNRLFEKDWKKSLAISIYFVLFFLFAQPYIISEMSFLSKALFLISYGFSIFIILFLVFKINYKIQFRYSFLENIINQIAIFGVNSILLITIIGKITLYYFIADNTINIKFLDILTEVIIASMLPLFLILFLFERNLFVEQQIKIIELKKIKNLTPDNEQLDIKQTVENENRQIIIKSEILKQKISLNIEDLLCVEANDNYSAVFYLKNNQITKELIRITLKGVENQLSEFNEIIRCHKSYLINYSKVIKVSGNSQEYKFIMTNLGFEIPISRKFPKELIDLQKEK